MMASPAGEQVAPQQAPARRDPATFGTQANALLRKNATLQKRNLRTNACLIMFPFLLCVMLIILQVVVNNLLNSSSNRCGCKCVETNGTSGCQEKCGIQYSTLDQVGTCPIPSPPEWPAFLQVPGPEYRAVKSNSSGFTDLPDDSCLINNSCPVTLLYTGQNKSMAETLAGNLVTDTSLANSSDLLGTFSVLVPGTDSEPQETNYIEPAFLSGSPSYVVQSSCSASPNSLFSFQQDIDTFPIDAEFQCVESRVLWRDNSSVVNKELFQGYFKGNAARKINEFVAAYDFMNSNTKNFNVTVGYNGTFSNATGNAPYALLRIPRSMNLVSQAFLHLLKGANVQMPLEFVKEMPKPATKLEIDFSSLLGPLFFLWVIELLFPVILASLVYEKQNNQRIMMKMHGLGDGPYWIITYGYFLVLSIIYMVCFVGFGSAIGLKFFRLNDYSIQIVFYFIYINLQIALGFLAATAFSDVKTATVVGYLYNFGIGLLASFLFIFFVEDTSFPRIWILVMEIVPGFSLYRGLYELANYALMGVSQGTVGMRWKNLNDHDNGMKEVLIIMFIEWLIILPAAYYLDQVVSLGSGIRRHPLFFLDHMRKKSKQSFRRPSLKQQSSKVTVEMEKPDVAQERELVEKLLQESSQPRAIICDNLKKVYSGQDGNSEKYAVRGLSLAVPRGECFGMLGPNGAGKTTSINMMIGLLAPTSGTAFIGGLDIRTDMDKIYTSMGVCPQHDLIWETLTGREHLLFYGRLKNLKGVSLQNAVEESLKSVDLFNGGVGDKPSGKYSGGMKRRLSVAISLIGDPQVVYMDEPSTGLDPASRSKLWNVVKQAKENRAIILTTHSMEEAEVLCDRMGIFVDGQLQCIGNSKELKGRYGGSYVLTITTAPTEEEDVMKLVQDLSRNAKKVYSLSGTQKFELPKLDIQIAAVFRMIERAKSYLTIQAWGIADITLEDVFIKVARESQSAVVLS